MIKMDNLDRLLDEIDYEAVLIEKEESELPHVTHRGILKLGALELEVLMLNDGRRVLSEEGLERFVKFMEDGVV